MNCSGCAAPVQDHTAHLKAKQLNTDTKEAPAYELSRKCRNKISKYSLERN